MEHKSQNLDKKTVKSFGDEWSRFNQSELSQIEAEKIFNEYFEVFPWDRLTKNSIGFDMGCGSGRWAKFMAPRIGHLHCIDPSDAIEVAKLNLASLSNITYHRASTNDNILELNSQDFGYSLGVLHHVPDTEGALINCVKMLKHGAPFQIYLYYAFDNKSLIYKFIWKCSDALRYIIAKLPPTFKNILTDILAAIIYFPLARLCLLVEKMGINVSSIPLSYYRCHSFYTMRTDSRDRFGTSLEKRFTKSEIEQMMRNAGLINIQFSENVPFWTVVGIKG